jgi:3-hydroxyisobutyrate dehydrogenase-like beta-hydroxyacid dehydrogenase
MRIGILHPGELGSVLGAVLSAHGHRILTCVTGRSERTCAAAATFEDRPCLHDLSSEVDVVLSVVPPIAAIAIAEQFSAAAKSAAVKPLYVDMNAISPITLCKVSRAVEAGGLDLVDGAVHGLASRFGKSSVLYLSGERSCEVERLFSGILPIRTLGPALGRASALKMLTGGLNKGLAGLTLELSAIAERAGLLEEFLGMCRDQYPGILAVAERVLPSYRRHAPRRSDELKELASFMTSRGIVPDVVEGASRTIRKVRCGSEPASTSLAVLLRDLTTGM